LRQDIRLATKNKKPQLNDSGVTLESKCPEIKFGNNAIKTKQHENLCFFYLIIYIQKRGGKKKLSKTHVCIWFIIIKQILFI